MNQMIVSPGKYIVAVSGGVDSVALLDMLAKQKDLELIIAHVDHGIRNDSHEDAELVESLAQKHKLQYFNTRLELGPDASEDVARRKRYEFLKKLQNQNNAVAIITAHHQDDLIETAFINLVRGTGVRGISSIESRNGLIRPLLNLPKSKIIEYAVANNLEWREDKTNQDTKYLRNNIRNKIQKNFSDGQKNEVLKLIDEAKQIEAKLDSELSKIIHRTVHKNNAIISRKSIIRLDHDVAKEVIRYILVANKISEIDRNTVERVVIGIKTLPPGKTIQISNMEIELTKRSARLKKNSKIKKLNI